MDQFQELLATIKDMQRRLTALESYSQVQKLIFKDNSGTPRILIDGINGVMKVSRTGFDVTSTANVNLVFNSNFSMFREVQMQTNPDHEFTSSTSWVELLDGQIQLNYADWTDNNMYFESVMKTGDGTGYLRLRDLGDLSELVEISTTSLTAVSVRSPAITKPTTGIHNYNESQKIAGTTFVDIYIGRVVMRYDF